LQGRTGREQVDSGRRKEPLTEVEEGRPLERKVCCSKGGDEIQEPKQFAKWRKQQILKIRAIWQKGRFLERSENSKRLDKRRSKRNEKLIEKVVPKES